MNSILILFVLLFGGSAFAASPTVLNVIGDTGDCDLPGTAQVSAAMRRQGDFKDARLIEVGDLAYHCNYFTAALLIERGADLVTRQHQRRHTDFVRGLRLGRRDHLVDWVRPQRPSWMDHETYARMADCADTMDTALAGYLPSSARLPSAWRPTPFRFPQQHSEC